MKQARLELDHRLNLSKNKQINQNENISETRKNIESRMLSISGRLEDLRETENCMILVSLDVISFS